MKKITSKSEAVLTGILDYLKETGDQALLPEVTKSLEKEILKLKETDEIIVTSAVKLTQQQIKNLQTTLKKILHVKLPVVNRIDKNLIGGFTVKINDWYLDASINRELLLLKRSLLS